jgi:tripartite ATP-independent transporter DctP family solute receptor
MLKEDEEMMYRKLLCIAVLAMVATLGLWANGQGEGTEAAGKPVVMRYATVHPKQYPNGQTAAKFAEMVEAATEGRVKVEVYYSGELGDQKSYIEQCQMGTLDFGDVNAAPLENFVPEVGVLLMPYLFENRAHKWRVLGSSVGEGLLATCENANLYGLSFLEAGERSYYADKPIRTLEDLEGLKIRVQQSQVCIDGVNAMGPSAVPMAFSEIYSAGQSGVINGNECNHPTYLSQSHYEVFPYFTFDEHVAIPDMLVASKKNLDKLSPVDREAIFEIARGLWSIHLDYYEANEDKAYDELVEKGVTFITLSPEEMLRFRTSVTPVYEKYGTRYEFWLDRLTSME